MPRITQNQIREAVRRLRTSVDDGGLPTDAAVRRLHDAYIETQETIGTAETMEWEETTNFTSIPTIGVDWTERPPVLEEIEFGHTASGRAPAVETPERQNHLDIELPEADESDWLIQTGPRRPRGTELILPREEEPILPALVCHYCKADIEFVPEDSTKMYQCECKSTNLFGVRTLYKNLSRNLI